MRAEARLEPISFEDVAGWREDSVEEGWQPFLRSAQALVEEQPALRDAVPASPAVVRLAREALETGHPPRKFIEASFAPHRIAAPGFVTAYYEPVVDGSERPTAAFTAPILARPRDLGRRDPYPTRGEIRAGLIDGQTAPLVWLRDAVEIFLIQVQGSAKVRLPDGRMLRLVYDGRNGRPYASIGRILVEEGAIAPQDMSLSALKAWLRGNGADAGGPADAVMNRNESYVFFRAEPVADTTQGPIGGQGVALTTLRSLAVDRTVWSYGLPFWVEPDFSAPTGFPRLMIAQDTGSAIVGVARADLFFGSGEQAGERAGLIRHSARLTVFLPRAQA